jgi:hypothetical protein
MEDSKENIDAITQAFILPRVNVGGGAIQCSNIVTNSVKVAGKLLQKRSRPGQPKKEVPRFTEAQKRLAKKECSKEWNMKNRVPNENKNLLKVAGIFLDLITIVNVLSEKVVKQDASTPAALVTEANVNLEIALALSKYKDLKAKLSGGLCLSEETIQYLQEARFHVIPRKPKVEPPEKKRKINEISTAQGAPLKISNKTLMKSVRFNDDSERETASEREIAKLNDTIDKQKKDIEQLNSDCRRLEREVRQVTCLIANIILVMIY